MRILFVEYFLSDLSICLLYHYSHPPALGISLSVNFAPLGFRFLISLAAIQLLIPKVSQAFPLGLMK